MKKMGIAVAVLGLFSCVSPAAPKEGEVVLLEARTVSFSVLDQGSKNHDPAIIDLSGDVLVQVDAIDVIIGRLPRGRYSSILQMTAIPAQAGRRDIYLLARTGANRSLETVWWNYSGGGLCIDAQTASTLEIEDEVADLRKDGKLDC